jgi:hypothetical protein
MIADKVWRMTSIEHLTKFLEKCGWEANHSKETRMLVEKMTKKY